MDQIVIGQIWRDTYGNSDKYNKANGITNKRTVRVIGQEPDGRWLVETLTNSSGQPDERGRKSRISEKTFRSGYVLQDTPSSGQGGR